MCMCIKIYTYVGMHLLLAQILTHTQTHTHTRTHIHTHAHTHVLQTRLCLLAIKAPFNHNRVTGYIGVGLAKTVYIYGLYTVVLAEKAPNIRSYTVFIYGSGQPCICHTAQQLPDCSVCAHAQASTPYSTPLVRLPPPRATCRLTTCLVTRQAR